MKVIDPNRAYIDYIQSGCASSRGLTNRFGIRVREGLCLAVIKIGDGQANGCGQEFQIPVQLESLPSYVRMIVDDYLLNDPGSDLMDVLAGKKSFYEALDSPTKLEPKRMMASRAERLP